jgi:hypothetical protein
MIMKLTLIAAALLVAAPALAQTPSGDAELQSQVPFYQSVPAHEADLPGAVAGRPSGDAELLSQLAPSITPAHQAQVSANRIPTGDAQQQSNLAIKGLGLIDVQTASIAGTSAVQ